jgi:hypothetical protein
MFQGGEVSEVRGLDDLALHHGEVDPVEPDAWIGRWTSTTVGHAWRIRSTEACPAWEEPLSTTQNTRRAAA